MAMSISCRAWRSSPQPPSLAATTDTAVQFTSSILEWGQVKGVLTAAQRQTLQAEAARQLAEHPLQ